MRDERSDNAQFIHAYILILGYSLALVWKELSCNYFRER